MLEKMEFEALYVKGVNEGSAGTFQIQNSQQDVS